MDGENQSNQRKSFNRGEDTLEPTKRLIRFLYIGNDKNVYICQRCVPISSENLSERLEFIKEMALQRYNLPFEIIKKIIQSNTLPRNDEAILAIAFLLRLLDNISPADLIKMKTEIYKELPTILKTDSDLFLFVHHSQKMRCGFSHGMRNALFQWYERRSPMELANIFGRNRGMHRWTHTDILRLCHFKFDGETNNDKAKVIATLFERGTKTIRRYRDQPPDPTFQHEGLNRTFQICNFKVNESPKDAADRISLHNFEIKHLPAHLISQSEVWDVLIPKMKYTELLTIIPTLQAMGKLQPSESISKKISMAIGNANLIGESNLHPLVILAFKKLYESNERYNEHVKKDIYKRKRVAKLKLTPNIYIVKRLTLAINHAIQQFPQTGCDYFVTLDLRNANKKHTVYRMNQLTCLEVMVLFALTLKKREKNTKIYTFVDNANTLVPVKITNDMTFEKALAHCDEVSLRQTKEDLALPFKYVNRNSKKTIFITIVDSVARFCRHREAPIDELRAYRQTHTHSKYIVLNLRRHSGDLDFSYEKGILEICGLTPDIWKIISAFAANSFC